MFQKVRPYRVHFNRGFNSPDGLPLMEYRSWLLGAVFGICPIGRFNLDCFRLYEVMEAGAIPVTLARTERQPYAPSYWELLFGQNPPFVHRGTWGECLLEVQSLLGNPEACEMRRKEVCRFWAAAKERYKKDLHARIENLNHE